MASTPYESWSKQDLIAKLTKLELGEKERVPISDSSRPSKAQKTFDFSSYPRRKIALKFCYSGWAYNGLAIQSDATPLPTVEGVLYEALAKARLIDPDAGFEGCGWERCGRTDRGVSAGGQVVSLWVRTSRKTEHSYTLLLNRILPLTIRVLAWSPVTPEFSSRFACTSRHYKYFFAPDGLDISRMVEAANLLVGEHDFRNFCKLDPAKQLTTYRRRIVSADINSVSDSATGMHVLDLVGSAFLYHQVRHIMAILFLVGTGLEPPSIVTSLLNVEAGIGDPALPVVDTKPEYQMADALPLMLYECHYAPGAVEWQIDEEVETETDALAPSGAGLHHQLHSRHARSDMYATLNRAFLNAAAVHHAPRTRLLPLTTTGFVPDGRTPINIPLGGGDFRRSVKYLPLLERPRGEHFEVVNERWRLGKGARREERKRAAEDE
ncbi:pseudouridine synthase [Roridomyces roridus]|uniref:tRNA pseudouridine synthase n=1 Tax=Roridomyces roridus TaxID=1738132 RepID=A0AAD7BKH0_9AGAR|nr:pseudouridine synthase [Roridomyces roridus]